jgi:nucleotide-binding universal stress UspA family protein
MDRQTTSAFGRILIPLDGSGLAEQALPFARTIGGNQAEYVLVHVVPPAAPEVEWITRQVVATVEEIEARAMADARNGLLRAAGFWLGERPHIHLEVTDGDPAAAILRVAEQRRADLIVLASHGRGATGRLVFGSVADRLAHASPVPVLIVRPADTNAELTAARIDRLLVPLDGSDLSQRALPVAAALARQLAIPVLLVQAIGVAERIAPYPGAYAPPADVLQQAQAAVAESLAAAAAAMRQPSLTVTTEILVGPAFGAIADATAQGDIVVMASHGRSGIQRWLLGSVAEKLVRSGPVPVMIVPVGNRAPNAATA